MMPLDVIVASDTLAAPYSSLPDLCGPINCCICIRRGYLPVRPWSVVCRGTLVLTFLDRSIRGRARQCPGIVSAYNQQCLNDFNQTPKPHIGLGWKTHASHRSRRRSIDSRNSLGAWVELFFADASATVQVRDFRGSGNGWTRRTHDIAKSKPSMQCTPADLKE